MNSIFFLLLAFMLFSCGGQNQFPGKPPAHGAWVSSGGELFKDAHNPWWVKNTSRVTYCLQIDSHSFSAKPDVIAEEVDRAIATWKDQLRQRTNLFEFVPFIDEMFNAIGVGTQEFARIPCDGLEDLRFQFGHGTLTDEQKNYLKEPRRYAGIAVRTSYDEVNLRGKGFIYLASDVGPDHYDGGTHMMDTPWKHRVVLFLMLLHETGHVFGLPHIGSKYELMSAEFPELLMTKAFEYILEHIPEDVPRDFGVFVPRAQYSTCDPFVECLIFKINDQTREINVFKKKERKSRDEAFYAKVDELKLSITPSAVINLWLNPSQKIFPSPEALWPMIAGPYFMAGDGTGVMTIENEPARPVRVRVAPNYLEIYWTEGAEIKVWKAN